MPKRTDISHNLIHFTRGSSKHAFTTLQKILRERRLLGGNGWIRGRYNCVCFTEAPLPSLAQAFKKRLDDRRHAPFGVLFDKKWIFAAGGRPVIYQPESEYDNLLPETRWRHVRYEPTAEKPIDFTWEREWRVQCDQLVFAPQDAIVVVPSRSWAKRLQTSLCAWRVQTISDHEPYIVHQPAHAPRTQAAPSQLTLFSAGREATPRTSPARATAA